MESLTLLNTIKKSGAKILNEVEFLQLNASMNLVRDLHFCVADKNYKITWYANISILCVDDNTEVMFTGVLASNTWPVMEGKKSKMQLQFKNEKDIVCILITERNTK